MVQEEGEERKEGGREGGIDGWVGRIYREGGREESKCMECAGSPGLSHFLPTSLPPSLFPSLMDVPAVVVMVACRQEEGRRKGKSYGLRKQEKLARKGGREDDVRT